MNANPRQAAPLRLDSARLRPGSAWLPLLLLLALTLSATVQAQFIYQKVNGRILLTGYTGTDTDVTIPSTLEGLPVTAIAAYAFRDRTNLTRVTIPNSVMFLYGGAFYGCTGLTSVTIPDSLISLTPRTFDGCTGLTNFTLGAGSLTYSSLDGVLFDKSRKTLVTYPLGKVGTSYSIPDGVTAIGDFAFSGRTQLTSVTFPNSVTTIGFRTFSDCKELTGATIPSGVISIGGGAFYGCAGLTSVTISDSVTSIGDYAFFGCTGLSSVSIPDRVTSIGDHAFDGCTGLTSVTVGNSVTHIGDYAFYGCTGLTSVTIPASVTTVGTFAFSGCTGLTGLTIRGSVTYIAYNAFSGCTGLIRVYFEGDAPELGDYTLIFYDSHPTLYYRQGAKGWGPDFHGYPTVAWNPHIVTDDGMFGLPSGHLGFTLAGVAGISVVVEASETLGRPNWAPVSTNAFDAQGKAQFVDPASAESPGRFYRFRAQ